MTKTGTFGAALLCALLATTVQAGPSNDYAVGPGDLLQISVSGYNELSVSERVSENGTITFPYLEPLNVTRLSNSAVEKLIAQKLTQEAIIKNPQVSVLVIEFQSQLVSVLGQVNKPGQYPLFTQRRVVDLLAQAGGPIVSEAGSPAGGIAGDEATLTHRDGKSVKIDLGALFAGDSRQNLPIAAGDTIFVPRAPQFYVYGEVQKAGVYQLQHHMTVAQALSAGGGLTSRGSQKRMILKRKDDQGREYEMSTTSSDLLQPDDVLYVKQSLF